MLATAVVAGGCRPEPSQTDRESAALVTSSGAVTGAADEARTGFYPDQPALDPAIVGGPTFGRVFTTTLPLTAGEQVYAQPLVVGSTVFVATEANNLYALDAETGAITASRSLGPAWKVSDIGCGDLTPTIGVTGAPVVDAATGTAYLLSKTYRPGTSGPAAADAVWYLHAVDAVSLVERPGFPVEIAGTADNDPSIEFFPYAQMQRPGLLLMNGTVYAGFGGHCDFSNYRGWVIGVGTDGTIRSRFATEAGPQKAKGAGIWQAGGGLVSDGPGRIFFVTGNGYSNAIVAPTPGETPPPVFDESVVRLSVGATGTLTATDFFAPYDLRTLDDADLDFGSGAPVALPPVFGTVGTPNLLAVAGKEGVMYLLDRDDLGGFQQGPNRGDRVVSSVNLDAGLWSRPAVWPGDGGWVYVTQNSAPLAALRFGVRSDGVAALAIAGRSKDGFGYTSGSPIVTADGTRSGSALVWVTFATGAYGQGALRAYDAIPDANGKLTLRFEDAIGTHAKFTTPGVGTGRIYVGTADGRVIGYGSPKQTPVSGAVLDFGVVTVGSSSVGTATLVANADVTITALASSSSAFVLGAPSTALPATLHAGESLSLPVTFAPGAAIAYAAAIDVTTSAGPAAVSMRGSGQAAGPLLVASPGAVSFGGIGVGSTRSATVVLSNTGSAPLTFAAPTPPDAPFVVTGAPNPGQTLAPGAQVSVTIAFAPTDTGTFASALALGSDGGNVSVYLSGNAAYSGKLSLSPLTLDFGTVVPGSTKSLSFTITNGGATDITITKSKPPSLGRFVATTSLPEGSIIAGGATVTETITFTPEALGAFHDAWILTGSDGGGTQTVDLTGVAGTGDGLTAVYYDTIDLSGPGLTRVDPTVAFDWGNGSPAPEIAPDSFSARWTGALQAPATDTYTITTDSDDGIRLWLDGQLVIDNWTDHGPTENHATVALTDGQKVDVKLEYYENGGGARARLLWSSATIAKQPIPQAFLLSATAGDGLAATYFDDPGFAGATVSRIDPTVDFDWGNGSPSVAIGADSFSARWTGQVRAETTEAYTFTTESDDGVRLWVDGQLVIDNWTDHPPTTNSGTVSLIAGRRVDLKLEYYENGGGAVARLLWASPSISRRPVPTSALFSTGYSGATVAGDGLSAEYFDTIDLTGAEIDRTDATIDFDWGSGSPDPSLGADTFSARWTGRLLPPSTGTYAFATQSDDGVRLWIAGALVIDDWTDHPPREDVATVALTGGQPVDVRMEFYENGGGAVARLLWTPPGAGKQIIPRGALFSR